LSCFRNKDISKEDKTETVQKSEIDELYQRGYTEAKITRYLADKKKIAKLVSGIIHDQWTI
jgi:SOS response regulatory protein OraA/RecX